MGSAACATITRAGGDGTFEKLRDDAADDEGLRSNGPADTTENIELARACRQGDAPLVEELLRRYANPNSYEPTKMRSALHAACKHKHVAVVSMLLGSLLARTSLSVAVPVTTRAARPSFN